MKQEDIIRMAREAGFAGWKCDEEKIERFFRLAYEAGVAAEREACVQLCELWDASPGRIAAAIRARGQA